MSRKRAKDQQVDDAVPTEVLAEGSGANEVIDANAQSLVEAAQDLVEKRKERKGKGKKRPEAAAPTEEAEDIGFARASADAAAAEAAVAAEAQEAEDAQDAEAEAHSDADAARAAVAAVDSSAVVADEDGEPVAPRRSKGKSRKARAAKAAPASDETDSESESESDSDSAFDAAGGMTGPSDDAAEAVITAESETVSAVEAALMRAEAEVELGRAEDGEGGEVEEDDADLGAALPTSAATMDPVQLKYLVEALVFAADKPLTIERLRQLTRIGDVVRLEQALTDIAADYKDRGIALQVVSGGYQFRTNTQYSVWVQQLIAGRPVRLSRAQLETLAIVAYRQPITRPEIDEIRGVDSSATLRLLLDRSLIRTLGKKEDVGRPMLYGTTRDFLDFFSLNDLRELPTLREYSELTAESRKVMSDRLGTDLDEEEKILSRAVLDDEVLDTTATETEPFEDTASETTDETALSTASSTVRDGVEYDRWGQPLGPVGDEDEPETTSDEVGAASGSSFEERANLDLQGVEDREVPAELADASDADLSEAEADLAGEGDDTVLASADGDSDTPDHDDESLPE